jgi:hypothetical protein
MDSFNKPNANTPGGAATGNERVSNFVPEPARDVAPGAHRPYIRFRSPDGQTFLASPVKFLPGNYQQNVIQPGSHDPPGNPGIWASETDGAGFADWVDDPNDGLFTRKLYVVNDALRARGQIGGVPYIFIAVLQIGQNVVVYQLNNSDTGEYIAYGFPIEVVDAIGAMAQYFQRIGRKREQLSTAILGSMADRILEKFPTHHVALFNKGVTLISEQKFAEAHARFELALNSSSDDQLTLLYDATALSRIGQHEKAMTQFAKADSISEEWVRKNIAIVPDLPKQLSVSVFELMRADPRNQHYADLWSKYFPSRLA